MAKPAATMTAAARSRCPRWSIAELLADLGPDPGPVQVLRTVAHAFLPTDDVSRRSMLLYHGFAAVALTDPSLRRSEMFTNGRGLVEFLGAQLGRLDGRGGPDGQSDDEADANGLVSLLLGLSLAVLLEQTSAAEAEGVLDRHLDRLTGR